MARPIVLSNGKLHVGLNDYGQVHDFYFPYVGLENHSAGKGLRHQIGVWADNQISWLNNKNTDWKFRMSYHQCALIGHTRAVNDRLGIVLEFDDFVDANNNAFIRNIHIINNCEREREVRLFMHQAFAIGDSLSNTDTVQYLPDDEAVLHYRGRRAFVVSGQSDGKPFDQHTVGLFGIENREGTYRDAEDGELSYNDVEHGRVDSTVRFITNVSPNGSKRVHYWITAGLSTKDAIDTHKKIKNNTIMHSINKTTDWWYTWLEPARTVVKKIPAEFQDLFLKSVMIVKSHMDEGGAVIASTDTSMLNYSRDAYAYSWPRDSAYALWPMIRMGYTEEAYKFFNFTKRGLHTDGYMMHKYRADGAIGSSWHPYVHEGDVIAPPIQEDETALPLYIFAQYYKLHPNDNLIEDFYDDMVKPMGDFLANYVDKATGLPKPSYNLWEEKFIVSTYTTGVTYAALIAASDVADSANDSDSAVKWRLAANDIQEAAHKYLYNPDRKVFRRGVKIIGQEVTNDDTIDCSSVFGAYTFALFAPDSLEVKNSVEALKQRFGINENNLGLPRYENDEYCRSSLDIAGNPWFITTLWLAQYYIDNGEREEAMKILSWVKSKAMQTGVMAEQLDPITDKIVSPAPLTWTHAEFVSTLLDLISMEA